MINPRQKADNTEKKMIMILYQTCTFYSELDFYHHLMCFVPNAYDQYYKTNTRGLACLKNSSSVIKTTLQLSHSNFQSRRMVDAIVRDPFSVLPGSEMET